MNIKNRTIFTGDCLRIMRGMADDCIDLIYLDPPFNANRIFDAPIGTEAEGSGFDDIWKWSDISSIRLERMAKENESLHSVVHSAFLTHGGSMAAYLIYMADRLVEMERVLKDTGAIYLHCDDNAGHFLKILMDCIFGKDKYYASIIWKKTSAHNDKLFGDVNDFLFCYGNVSLNPNDVRIDLDHEYVNKQYRFQDHRGRYRSTDLTGAGVSQGESGKPWNGYDPSSIGRHWSVPKTGEYAKFIHKELVPGYLDLVEKARGGGRARTFGCPERGGLGPMVQE